MRSAFDLAFPSGQGTVIRFDNVSCSARSPLHCRVRIFTSAQCFVNPDREAVPSGIATGTGIVDALYWRMASVHPNLRAIGSEGFLLRWVALIRHEAFGSANSEKGRPRQSRLDMFT